MLEIRRSCHGSVISRVIHWSAAVLFHVVLLSACKTSDRPAGATDPERKAQDGALIVGSWVQDCINAQTQSVLSRMTFAANGTWTGSVKIFSDSFCKSAVYEILSEGTYVVGAIQSDVAGLNSSPVDRFTTQVSETFFLDAQILANNQAGYRGYRKWQKGVPFSHPPDVSAQYDIFRVEGDTLMLGKVSQVAGSPNDGLTPQTRPTEISTEMKPLRRQ